MRHRRLAPIGSLAILLLLPAYGSPQSATGTILGRVADASGLPLDGASIVIVRIETGAKRPALSGARGEFVAADLPVGLYRVSASHPGFRTAVREPIRLEVDEKARVDFVLEVGPIEQTLTVTGDAPVGQA